MWLLILIAGFLIKKKIHRKKTHDHILLDNVVWLNKINTTCTHFIIDSNMPQCLMFIVCKAKLYAFWWCRRHTNNYDCWMLHADIIWHKQHLIVAHQNATLSSQYYIFNVWCCQQSHFIFTSWCLLVWTVSEAYVTFFPVIFFHFCIPCAD